MYLAIRDATIRDAGYKTLKEGLEDLGLKAIELEYLRNDIVVALDGSRLDMKILENKNAIKTQLKENNIKICAFLFHNNFRSKDLEEELKWITRCIECAYDFGIEAVRIDAVMEDEKSLSVNEARSLAVKCLREILNRTKGINVSLGMENHGFQGNNPEFLNRIIEEVDSPRMGVTMDTGNFYWSGKPLDEVYKILEQLAPKTKHTHVKNIKYPPELINRKRELGWEYEKYVSPIYEGDINHKKIVDFLNDAGYKGDFTIEDESLGKFKIGQERIEVLKRDILHLQGML